jgi:hypothetical protein
MTTLANGSMAMIIALMMTFIPGNIFKDRKGRSTRNVRKLETLGTLGIRAATEDTAAVKSNTFQPFLK